MKTFNELHPYIHIIMLIISFCLIGIGIMNFMLNVKLSSLPKIKNSELWRTVELEFSHLKDSVTVLKVMEQFIFLFLVLVNIIMLWKLSGFEIHFLDGTTPLIYLFLATILNIVNYIYTINIMKFIPKKYKTVEYYYEKNFPYFNKNYELNNIQILVDFLEGKEKVLFESFKTEILETSKYYSIQKEDIKWLQDFIDSIQESKPFLNYYEKLVELDTKYSK